VIYAVLTMPSDSLARVQVCVCMRVNDFFLNRSLELKGEYTCCVLGRAHVCVGV
jgi:hypothetical protein